VSKAKVDGWGTVRVIAWARAFSMLGDELAMFALLLRVKHYGGGALSVALILAAGYLPLILLSPWAGNIADRVPVRRLAPIANIVQAGLALLLAFHAPLIVSLILIALLGAGQAFTGPAWTATLPEIVGKDAVPKAMSLSQALYAVAGLVGPGVAGLMVSKLGYVTPMIANAVTFAVLAFVPLFIGLPFHARSREPRKSGDVWAGLQIVRREPVIRALSIMTFCLVVAINALEVALIFFVLDTLHASQFIYGLIGSAFAAGGLAGALVNERREVSQARLPANTIVGTLMCGGGVLLMGFAWHWALLIPAMVLVGIGNSTINAYGFGMIIQRAPDESRARVTSAVQALMALGTLLALAIGGLVVPVIGPRKSILLDGAASLLVIAVMAPSFLRSATKNQTPEVLFPLVITEFPLSEIE
jgi:MFS family permease